MTGENIVCFAKDWSEDPTSNNHVMRLLARENRVLWLNSISTRTPDFKSGRDLGKMARKLASFAKGPNLVDGGLNVYTPIVLPFPHSPAATRLNREILRGTVGALRRKLHMGDFQLWSFIPTAAEYVGKLGESLVVYYCTDEWSHFSYVDSEKIVRMEKELCERADIVFTTAKTLLERKRAYNPETHLASHGVDYAHFAQALAPETAVALEIAALPKPIVGFVGLIQDWVDLELIAYVAKKKPDWSIVLIGKALVDTSRLAPYPNVHVLGRKAYAELPSYCKGFDVAIIPFAITELTRNVNPIKLREYLSAGLPVVSSPIPEVALYADQKNVWVARGEEEFLASLETAIMNNAPETKRARSDEMKKETWERKVEDLAAHVARVRAKRGRR
jgi:glycosyltransferase involved in cell wall biosynthesis